MNSLRVDGSASDDIFVDFVGLCHGIAGFVETIFDNLEFVILIFQLLSGNLGLLICSFSQLKNPVQRFLNRICIFQLRLLFLDLFLLRLLLCLCLLRSGSVTGGLFFSERWEIVIDIIPYPLVPRGVYVFCGFVSFVELGIDVS